MRLWPALAVVASLGCAPIYAPGVRTGPAYPPRPPTCDLSFVHRSLASTVDDFEEVGRVCATFRVLPPPDDFDPDLLYDVRGTACRFGGEVAVPVGTCGPRSYEYAVLRRCAERSVKDDGG